MDTSQIPPLEKIIHLVFMYHETRAYAAHGNAEKAAILRGEESDLYGCHRVARETVEHYASAYDRETVLSFFRNNDVYLEMERAFARASDEKFNIPARETSFTSATRIEAKHMRTIPVAEYQRVTAELNRLPRDFRRN
jgi:hypothetical protein